MNDPRADIRALRIKSCQGRYFVPESPYLTYMAPEIIRGALLRCGTEPWKLDELVTVITEGAKRIIGILILIRQEKTFIKFVEEHQGETRTMDAQLPFTRDKLSFLEPDMAEEFVETQWMFIAPTFAPRLTHRFFDDDTVLPFVEDLSLDGGGFGRVFLVKVHAGYHRYTGAEYGSQSQDYQLVRKELDTRQTQISQRQRQSSKALAKDEHTVLWLLSHLKHPNMLDLLGSYTFQGAHNFLFPMVEGGNLKQLLQSHRSLDAPWSQTDYFSALAGLSSAIQHLHNYRCPTMGDTLMGCHHDIKPANVLVRGKDLILADFGLSTIKEGDNSKTQFKTGRGIYKAPECEDYSNGFHPGIVGRSMDIWALGCIVMEVMIHLHWGPEGVADFKTGRKTVIPGVITTYAFHSGRLPNSGVENWLDKLEASGSFALPVAQEARRMLSMSPKDRPPADCVSATLYFAQACSMFQNIQEKLDSYSRDGTSSELRLEIQRYSLLGASCSLDRPESVMTTTDEGFLARILGWIHVLSEFDAILTTATDGGWKASFALLLGVANNRFSDLLTPQARSRVSTGLLQSFVDLNNDDQKNALRTVANNGDTPGVVVSDSDVGKQLAAMQMLSLMNQNEGDYDKGLRLRPERLINRRPFQAGELGVYLDLATEEEGNTKPVLIEWITYTTAWIGDQGTELFNRIGKVAQTLRLLSDLELFPTLQCKGFFHELNRHAFGLVYEIPIPERTTIKETGHRPAIISLNALIETSKNVRRRPSLERIFALALNLADALSKFHKVGWLHKNLSSYCVVFSAPANMADAVQTEQFYVCGFNHSRPDSPDEYSNGLCQRPETDVLYQHPDSRQNKTRYCRAFDRYSLGIMLLELGLWKPVYEMTDGLKLSDQKRGQVTTENASEFKRHILQQYVPLLGQRMGSHYRTAVEHCLVPAEDAHGPDLVTFDLLCVEKLRKCCSGYT